MSATEHFVEDLSCQRINQFGRDKSTIPRDLLACMTEKSGSQRDPGRLLD
jgi:hypothetical protein